MGKKLTGQISALAVGIAGMGAIFSSSGMAFAGTTYPASFSVSNTATSTYAAGAYQATVTFGMTQVGTAGSGNYALSITLDNTSTMLSNTNLLKGIEFTLSTGKADLLPSDIRLIGSTETITGTSYSTSLISPSEDTTLNNVKQNANWVGNSLAGGVFQFYGNQGIALVASTPASSGNPYPSANNGFFTSNNSTFLLNGPEFVLQIKGATGLPNINLNEVYFGTGSGPGDLEVTPGGPVITSPYPAGGPLPIPATLPLTAAGGLGLLALALRKRKATV